ncbi:TadE/TadG family type IV pilus assembly protein [Marinicauda sp. Alg238-R41]|uniref:TadE/TadG family type IV pilus assembly protein n=1 Tax=Marinicauda sp. Alg238-R41 TaxID=2993447 RepID=UPI0022E7649E|nr:TadE/TadG family type IV pilus assembly protein [Marinicauda sp. Alg238-R41]
MRINLGFSIKALTSGPARVISAVTRRLGAFPRATAANIAISYALALAPITTAIGGALDYTRGVMLGTEIQNALDSGVLAAASLTQDRDPDTVVRAYVEAALSDHPALVEALRLDVTSSTSFNSRRVQATASVDTPTLMLGLIGVKNLTISRTSEAVEEVRDIEISLVLDVSGSMGGSKISALRDAASEFIDVVLDDSRQERTSVSVIPYNGGVRLPDYVNEELNEDFDESGCPDMGEDHSQVIPYGDLPTINPLEWTGEEMTGHRSSSHCPQRHMESIFLRNSPGQLKSLIGGLDASGNTGLDVATGWGVRALDPSWRGRLGGQFGPRPVDFGDRDTVKVLVVMTDGAATAQQRTELTRSWWSWSWSAYELYSARTAREKMIEACSYAKDRGVVVYTIAFQLSGNTNRDLMRNCASRAETFYNVENTDIQSAFDAIASDINQLRIAR